MMPVNFRSLPVVGLILVLLCEGQSAGVCPEGWLSYKDSCYIVIETKKPWVGAQKICQQFGADLATISDPEENKALASLLPPLYWYHDKQAWVGLNDRATDGKFRWVKTNRKASWFNWGAGEPNNEFGNEDCVTLLPSGYWNDAPCSLALRFICELSP